MKQVVQSVAKGELKLVDVPQPVPSPTEVLVATRRSLLSAGTETAVRQLASASLLQKARARPDLVRQVLARARTEGVSSTIAAVRNRLDGDMPLGYSGSGLAVSVGEYVSQVRPGMRVATASAGHGDYQLVPGLLAVPIPDGVSDKSAAFGAVAAIALQGLRQADVGVGGAICVIGLGLVGQLTVRLALAAGLTVAGIDLREWTANLATSRGACGLVEQGQETTDRIRAMTHGRGVDAVLLTAATHSSEPIARATQLTRDRGRLVVVGDVGLQLDRRPFYEQELEIRFARSYGPGRYERSYEEWGVDFPLGQVRWTEGRNIEAFLGLVDSGRLSVEDLVTHEFPVERAAEAYELMQSRTPSLAVQLSYEGAQEVLRPPAQHMDLSKSSRLRAGIVGAGNYASATFLPALVASGWGPDLTAIASAKSLSSRHLATRYRIPIVLSDAESVTNHGDLDIIFVLSRHDSHAALVVQALDSGKHVFTEKPLAITEDQLDQVKFAYERNEGCLFVGFNRRYSEAMGIAQRVFSGTGPLSIDYRVYAGQLPESHWYKDRRQGGRLIGEMCHYIDFGNYLVGDAPQDIRAYASGDGEALLDESYQLTMSYHDGSTVSISYVTQGHPSTHKERIDVMGRGHTVQIDDFTQVNVDGRRIKSRGFSKGHVRQLRNIRETLMDGTRDDHFGFSLWATQAALMAQRKLLASVPPG